MGFDHGAFALAADDVMTMVRGAGQWKVASTSTAIARPRMDWSVLASEHTATTILHATRVKRPRAPLGRARSPPRPPCRRRFRQSSGRRPNGLADVAGEKPRSRIRRWHRALGGSERKAPSRRWKNGLWATSKRRPSGFRVKWK